MSEFRDKLARQLYEQFRSNSITVPFDEQFPAVRVYFDGEADRLIASGVVTDPEVATEDYRMLLRSLHAHKEMLARVEGVLKERDPDEHMRQVKGTFAYDLKAALDRNIGGISRVEEVLGLPFGTIVKALKKDNDNE